MKMNVPRAQGNAGGGCIGRGWRQSWMQTLSELRETNMLCDAAIGLDDGSVFPVHKAILSTCSPYFSVLFTTALHQTAKTDVTIHGLTATELNSLLEYAYLQKIDINSDNVWNLISTADSLAISGVVQLCCRFLKSVLSPENCIGILKYARDHFLRYLEREAFNFVVRNFVMIAQQSEEIFDLSIGEITEIIGSKELNVAREEAVWEFALRWINLDPENRKHHIAVLMSQIRLGLMDNNFFLESVKEHQYVSTNEECRPKIIDTLKFLDDVETLAQKTGEVSTPELARPRIPHEIIFAIGGWNSGSPTNYIETYDTRADRWVKVEEVDPAGPRAYHGTAVIGHDIYVIGGFNGVDHFNSCRCFNAVTKTWREISSMNARRCYVSVAVVDDIIYAMGGSDGDNRHETCEKYDYRTNQWTMIAPMNARRSDASATSLNGKIYITGGFNGRRCLSTAEMYDPELDTWSVIPCMWSRRSGVSCVAYHGCVYAIGGFNERRRIQSGEKFNPATNSWTPIRDMCNPRSNFANEVIDDMIFVMGGFDGITTSYSVECYDDTLNNEWLSATDMNLYKSALAACIVKDLPNVRDYICQHRDRVMEGKRLAILQQRQQVQDTQPQ